MSFTNLNCLASARCRQTNDKKTKATPYSKFHQEIQEGSKGAPGKGGSFSQEKWAKGGATSTPTQTRKTHTAAYDRKKPTNKIAPRRRAGWPTQDQHIEMRRKPTKTSPKGTIPENANHDHRTTLITSSTHNKDPVRVTLQTTQVVVNNTLK